MGFAPLGDEPFPCMQSLRDLLLESINTAVIYAIVRFKFNVTVSAEVAHVLMFIKLIVRQWLSAFRTFEILDNPFL